MSTRLAPGLSVCAKSFCVQECGQRFEEGSFCQIPYTCPYCWAACAQKSKLRDHCTSCGQTICSLQRLLRSAAAHACTRVLCRGQHLPSASAPASCAISPAAKLRSKAEYKHTSAVVSRPFTHVWRMSSGEEPDSPPALSASTAAILQQFLSQQTEAEENAAKDPFSENWQLSQVHLAQVALECCGPKHHGGLHAAQVRLQSQNHRLRRVVPWAAAKAPAREEGRRVAAVLVHRCDGRGGSGGGGGACSWRQHRLPSVPVPVPAAARRLPGPAGAPAGI